MNDGDGTLTKYDRIDGEHFNGVVETKRARQKAI
jgi:hypothetical protein